MNSTSDFELETLMKGVPQFHGCFSKDEVDKIPIGSMIINLNGSSHWTALIRNGNTYFYFDSYGVVPPQKLSDQMGNYIYNSKEIQAINSSSCGFYCVAFLKYMQKHGESINTFMDFVNHFTNEYIKNEHILKELL
jgi:hypothetical protein